MITATVRKAALALVSLTSDETRAALKLGRAIAKISPKERAAALRAAKLLSGETSTRRKKGDDSKATKAAKPAAKRKAEDAPAVQ